MFDANTIAFRGLPRNSLRIHIDRIFIARRRVFNRSPSQAFPYCFGSIFLLSGRKLGDALLKNHALRTKSILALSYLGGIEFGNSTRAWKLEEQPAGSFIAGLWPTVDALRNINERAGTVLLLAVVNVTFQDVTDLLKVMAMSR